jgi:hypothetical protein
MKAINLVVFIVGVAVLVMLVGGSIAGSAAEGFARGGGEMRVLSPSTEATAGDGGVAVSVQGDRNSIAIAYAQAQPTPVPAQPDGRQAADDVRGLAGLVMATFLAAVVIGAIGLMTFGTGKGATYQ